MQILMEKIKLTVLLKYELEYRAKLKIKRFIRNFRFIRILMQGRKELNIQFNTRLEVLFFY